MRSQQYFSTGLCDAIKWQGLRANWYVYGFIMRVFTDVRMFMYVNVHPVRHENPKRCQTKANGKGCFVFYTYKQLGTTTLSSSVC